VHRGNRRCVIARFFTPAPSFARSRPASIGRVRTGGLYDKHVHFAPAEWVRSWRRISPGAAGGGVIGHNTLANWLGTPRGQWMAGYRGERWSDVIFVALFAIAVVIVRRSTHGMLNGMGAIAALPRSGPSVLRRPAATSDQPASPCKYGVAVSDSGHASAVPAP